MDTLTLTLDEFPVSCPTPSPSPNPPWYGVWSLLFSPLPGVSRLYNLAADPTQSDNVIEQNMDVASELHRKLVRFMRETEVPERLLNPRLELRM